MTNLHDGQLTDLIQNQMRYNPDVMAMSYAIHQEKQRLMRLANGTRTMAMIDELPEKILDVLAVEMRSPYYDEGMDIAEKRSIIKASTFSWSSKAGTPAAVAEMASVIFGEAQVVEWFDFLPEDGEIIPGEFDLYTGSGIPADIMVWITEMNRIINRVKNARSHLRHLRFLRRADIPVSAATLPQSFPVVFIRNVITEEKPVETVESSSTLPSNYTRVTISQVINSEAATKADEAAAILPESHSSVFIQN